MSYINFNQITFPTLLNPNQFSTYKVGLLRMQGWQIKSSRRVISFDSPLSVSFQLDSHWQIIGVTMLNTFIISWSMDWYFLVVHGGKKNKLHVCEVYNFMVSEVVVYKQQNPALVTLLSKSFNYLKNNLPVIHVRAWL